MEDETESVQTRFKSHSVLYQGSRGLLYTDRSIRGR